MTDVTHAELEAPNGASIVGFQQTGTGSVASTVEVKARERHTLADKGADASGVAAVDTPLSNALSDSYADHNRTIKVANGLYSKTAQTTVTQGVMIEGEGSQGSTEQYGTTFRQDSNHTMFRWDGSNSAYSGTGGGMTNTLLLKANGTDGNAIELVAGSLLNRPGEMMFSNVLAYGAGSARFNRGFVVDGTAAPGEGVAGVRSVYLSKVRMADVNTPGESFLFNQVTHLYGFGIACDPGHGAPAGIALKGLNDGVFLLGTSCAGTVTIDATSSTKNFHFSGKIGSSFTNDDANATGTLAASFEEEGAGFVLLNRSRALKCMTNINPDFQMAVDTPLANVTGDGTVYNVVWDTEVFDQGNNWDGGGNVVFTCYCAGTYQFGATLLLSGLSASHSRVDLDITRLGSVAKTYAKVLNPYAVSANGYATVDLSTQMDLAYGDTVQVRVRVTGGGKTVGIHGAGPTRYSWFSGKYCGA